MPKLLTLESSLRYDGKLPVPGSVKVVPAEESIMKFAVVQSTISEISADPARWKEPVHRVAANIPTINALDDQKGLWQPAIGRTDIRALSRFVARYGPVTFFEVATHNLWAQFGRYQPGDNVATDPVGFSGLQFVLRWAWRGDSAAIALIAGESQAFGQFLKDKEGNYRDWAIRDDTGKKILQHRKDETGKDQPFIDRADVDASRFMNQDRFRPILAIQARVSVSTTGTAIITDDLWNFIRLSFLRDHLAGRTKICENPNCSAPYFIQTRRRKVYCSHDCAVAQASRNYRQRVKELVDEAKAKGTWSKEKE
jgi:hypothetical protein